MQTSKNSDPEETKINYFLNLIQPKAKTEEEKSRSFEKFIEESTTFSKPDYR